MCKQSKKKMGRNIRVWGFLVIQNCLLIYVGTVFLVEPKDVEIACDAARIVTFSCRYINIIADYSHLQWIINSVEYNLTQLPPHHRYDGHVLTVRNINLNQHNSTYQCQFLSTVDNCVHRSTVGRLIIKCQGIYYKYYLPLIIMIVLHAYGIAFDVHCLPSYHFQNNGNSLKEIESTISQVMTIICYDSIIIISGLSARDERCLHVC